MKSDHKAKQKGSSPSHKKKLKRKYRNDRSKRKQGSSSATSSDEELSLSSDEYSSPKEERLKKVKHRQQTSVSSSRSPSPGKLKKKIKSKDKEKCKKKKRSYSSESELSSEELVKVRSDKKERKKRSPSPMKSKRKSLSPRRDRGRSSSPKRTKRKSNLSPHCSKGKKSSETPSKESKHSKSKRSLSRERNDSPPLPIKSPPPKKVHGPALPSVHLNIKSPSSTDPALRIGSKNIGQGNKQSSSPIKEERDISSDFRKEISPSSDGSPMDDIQKKLMPKTNKESRLSLSLPTKEFRPVSSNVATSITVKKEDKPRVSSSMKNSFASTDKVSPVNKEASATSEVANSKQCLPNVSRNTSMLRKGTSSQSKAGSNQIKENEKTNNNLRQDGENISSPTIFKKEIDKRKSNLASYEKSEGLNLSLKSTELKSNLNADTKGDKNTPALIESDKNLSPLISKPGASSKLDTSFIMNNERLQMKDSKVKFSPLTNRKLLSSKFSDDIEDIAQTGTSLSTKNGNSTVSITISGTSILSKLPVADKGDVNILNEARKLKDAKEVHCIENLKDTEDRKSPKKLEATQELKDSKNLAHLKEKNGTENEKVGSKTKRTEILIKEEDCVVGETAVGTFSSVSSRNSSTSVSLLPSVKPERESFTKTNYNINDKKEDIKKEDIKITSSTEKSKPPVIIKKITIASTKKMTTSSALTATTGEKGDSPFLSKKVPMISQKSKKSSPRRSSKSPSPWSRRRSRSPRKDRKRSRSRSPVRYRDKQRRRSISPDRRRDRDRSRSPDRKRKDDRRRDDDKKDRDEKDRKRGREERSKESKKDDSEKKTSKGDNSPEKKDISELEEEMKKRKERIEAWRNANKTKSKGSIELLEEEPGETNVTKKSEKKWSLEDDDSEDEVTGKVNTKKEAKKDPKVESKKENEDDDPLDMFMKSIDAEVNKISGRNTSEPAINSENKTKTITVVKTIATVKPVEPKPEVIEQNQDALEYSSEEEDKTDITASDFADQTKRKKELTVADHTKIYYAPFRRDFYVEVPELVRLSTDEVKIMRDSMGDIQVRGRTIPKPIKSWAQAGHSPKVMSVLKKFDYEKPTPIQAQALPVIMSGRDMIGIAKTGSGKTLAFLLPMFRHVLDQPALDEDDGPISIIMAPTRELALQIYREAKKFCKVLNINVTCIYGGSGISEQIAELKKGTEIIVCTPGRMIDMLAANNGRVTNCRRCTFLVLDEADRMFDMGFEPQVMRIIGNIRPDRQTVLFSATFPRQMEAVARKVLTKPIEVQVGGRSIVCSDIEQHAIVIEEDNKFLKVLELLGVYQVSSSILIFVERQDTADLLLKDLLKKGYPCLSLHGGMDQFDRDSTIADFKNGVSKLMVSTSVAARGLDVKNLNVVVNYDCPNHYEDYVHRVGRTGRAGNKGMAFTLITPEQGRSAGDVIKAFELAESTPPEDLVSLWDNFKADMEKEGKTIKMNSGFTGTKGFKFNAEEDAMVNESKKIRKFTLGLQDSDEEAEAADDAIEKIEADLEKAFSSKPKVALQPEVAEGQKTKIAENNIDKDKLKQAISKAAIINKKLSSGQVVDRNTAATAHIMQGGALESLTGVGLAKQLADKVNAKLNYKAAEVEAPAEEKQIAVRYEEEIDINDFPQQARWRITSKEIIEQVREVSEAGVTVRGLYIPPNKKPNEDERRLHLYIESLSERSIQIAKAEIKRLLKEELLKSENSYRPAQPMGRYKVL